MRDDCRWVAGIAECMDKLVEKEMPTVALRQVVRRRPENSGHKKAGGALGGSGLENDYEID